MSLFASIGEMLSELGRAMIAPPKDWFGRYLIGLLWAIVLTFFAVLASAFWVFGR